MAFYYTEIKSNFPVEEVHSRIQDITKKDPGAIERSLMRLKRNFDYGVEFYGSIWRNSFLIKRNIFYQNSFLPIVYGKSESTLNGAKIRVFMFMHPFPLVLSLIMLFGIGKQALKAVLENNYFDNLPIIFAFLFVLILSMGGFLFEAINSKKILIQKINT